MGTGPYTLVTHNQESGQYLFKANPDYFKGKPIVNEISYISVENPVLALKNKEMDAVMIQKYADMEQLEKTGYFYRLKHWWGWDGEDQTGSSRVDWHSCWSGRAGEAILWRHFWDWKRIRGQISCCRTTEIVPGRRDGAANGYFFFEVGDLEEVRVIRDPFSNILLE
ncbi:hypothetical protein BSNK01_04860 [Bacillaceae bacterium]